MSRDTLIGWSPDTGLLDHPPRLDCIDRLETNRLLEPSSAAAGVVGCLELSQLDLVLHPRESIPRLDAVRVLREDIENSPK